MNITQTHQQTAYTGFALPRVQSRTPVPPSGKASAASAPASSSPSRPDNVDKSDKKDAASAQDRTPSGSRGPAGQNALTDNELRLLEKLKQIDGEIKRHEMAHIAAGGRYISSGANFTYKTGPDGRRYAVAGDVKIDASPVPGDPRATAEKMQQVKRAALAPAEPSAQDRRVAAKASALGLKAMSELMIQQVKEKTGLNARKAFGTIQKEAGASYSKVQNSPAYDRTSFKAVA